MKLYDIVRFYRDGTPSVIKYGLTLEDAKEHCSRDDTSGDGWFDGFRESDSVEIGESLNAGDAESDY